MDLFGIKARRAARKAEKEQIKAEKERIKLEQLQAEKKLYQERKAKINAYWKKYNEREEKIVSDKYREEMAEYRKLTSSCPRCKSTDVIQHFVRTKGEMHGEGNSYGSMSGNFLSISGHYHGSSKIDGELDTYPVNKCKTCGHEWVIEQPKVENADDVFNSWNSATPNYLYRRIEEYLEMKYDPKDLTDECNSLEEKKVKFIERTSHSSILEPLKTVPRYMVEYALYNGITGWCIPIYNELDPRFGDVEHKDRYSYTMPDDLWELVKKILGWNGEE